MTLLIILRLIYEAYFRFPHFKILKVGIRNWKNKDLGDLTTYQIELKTKKASSELVFEELWIDKKRYKFNLSNTERKIGSSFGKKEILNINVVSEFGNEITPLLVINKSKGALLLGYSFKNKRKYIRFNKFRNVDELRISGAI